MGTNRRRFNNPLNSRRLPPDIGSIAGDGSFTIPDFYEPSSPELPSIPEPEFKPSRRFNGLHLQPAGADDSPNNTFSGSLDYPPDDAFDEFRLSISQIYEFSGLSPELPAISYNRDTFRASEIYQSMARYFFNATRNNAGIMPVVENFFMDKETIELFRNHGITIDTFLGWLVEDRVITRAYAFMVKDHMFIREHLAPPAASPSPKNPSWLARLYSSACSYFSSKPASHSADLSANNAPDNTLNDFLFPFATGAEKHLSGNSG